MRRPVNDITDSTVWLRHGPDAGRGIRGAGRLGRRLLPLVGALIVAAATVLPATAQVPVDRAGELEGFATGTAVHAHGLQVGDDTGGTRVVNGDVALSGAAVDSRGLAQALSNEMGLRVHPALSDKVAYGRGTALEAGVGTEVPDGVNDVVLPSLVEASAPPATGVLTDEVGPVDADPLAFASLVRGQAEAPFRGESCLLGRDLAFGLGYAADAQLADTAADGATATRSAGQEVTGGQSAEEPADSQRETLTGQESESGTSTSEGSEGQAPAAPDTPLSPTGLDDPDTQSLGGAPASEEGEEPSEQVRRAQAGDPDSGSAEDRRDPQDQVQPAQQEEGPGLEQPVLASSAPDPTRAVSQTRSRTFLTAQLDSDGDRVGDAAAVAAEVRETIAPVTFLKGTANQFTVEVLGEWALRATATGIPGTASIHYGPRDVSPETPVVRILRGGQVVQQVTTQQLLGGDGLVVDLAPVARISIGAPPHAIGDPGAVPAIAGDGTQAAAAVDVVSVELLTAAGVGEAAEVRIGHMETRARAPEGGVECDLPVAKTPDKEVVGPGETFTYTITVANPNACPLTDVRVVDVIEADDGVTWTVEGTTPQADQISDTRVVWEGRGPIPPDGSETFQITITVGQDSAAGVFHDRAEATALCGEVPVTGQDDERVPVHGQVRVDAPRVVITEQPAAAPPAQPAGQLPRTGGGSAAIVGLAAIAAATALRRRLA